MFWTFNLSFDIWARFPNIGRVFAQYSGHSADKEVKFYKIDSKLFVFFADDVGK
jgi:hypothetical protein